MATICTTLLKLFLKTIKPEKSIHTAEARLGEVETQLADPAVYGDGEKTALFSRERSALEQQMEKLSTRWEQAATELEALENRLREEDNG